MNRKLPILGFLIAFALAPAAAHAQQAWSGILDPSRAVDWTNAGFAVPTFTTVCTTLSPGVTSAQINSAISACPNGQVVSLNAGIYSLSGDIVMKSNVVLRGAGASTTLLQFSAGGGACNLAGTDQVCFGGSFNWSGGPNHLTTWTAGYAKGSTQLTLGSTSGLSVGQILILDQADDASDTGNYYVCQTLACSTEGGSPGRTVGGANYTQQEYKLVTNIAGNVVTISPPLYSPNWRSSQTPGAWWANSTIQNAGIENLTLDYSASSNLSGIAFFNAYKCWAKNVRSIYSNSSSGGGRNHVWMQYSKNIVVRDSYFFGTRAAATLSYGVETWQTGDCLVENNVFQQVVSPLVIGNAEGCVFGYNFGANDFNNNLTFNMPGPSFTHDGGTAYNLFEGNQGTGEVEDSIHGTHNMHTYFRNLWFIRDDFNKISQTTAAQISSYARYMAFIGNVMGLAGYNNKYQVIAPDTGNCNTAIFSFGFQSGGCNTPLDATLTSSTALRWGNWDTVTNATRWCGNSNDTGWSTICGSTSEIPTGLPVFSNAVPTKGDTGAGQSPLPASFYLSGTPSWWSFSSIAASPFPAVGPDVTGGTLISGIGVGSNLGGHAYLIPARACYLNVMGGLASGTGLFLSFDASTCYGSSTVVRPNAPTNLNATVQ